MNSPDVLRRFVQAVAPSNLVLSYVAFTAPLRAFTGSLTAIAASCFDDNAWQKCFVPNQELTKQCNVIWLQIRRIQMGFGRGALLWLIGVPLPIVLLLALFMHH
jgi:hypothetical protein